MKPPPPLCLELRRSRLAAALIVVSYAATATLLAGLPLAAGTRVAGGAGVVAACAWTLRQVAGRRAPMLLRVGIDRSIAVTSRDAASSAGEILADSYVGARLTTIVWRPDRALRVRTLIILPDMLPADDYRRLRVLLRYGRTADAAPEASGVDAG